MSAPTGLKDSPSLKDEDILSIVKEDSVTGIRIRDHIRRRLSEQEKERREAEKTEERRQYDLQIGRKLCDRIIKEVVIEEYGGGEYEDSTPTVMKLVTDAGVFRVNDPREVVEE